MTSTSYSSRPGNNQKQKADALEFTPIPITYGELYKSLFDAHMVSPFYVKPFQPSYPKWYNPEAKCAYHVGTPGHSIEDCTAFKKLVERLIKMGVIWFDDTANKNPLPNHAKSGVNAIPNNGERKIKTDLRDVKPHLN